MPPLDISQQSPIQNPAPNHPSWLGKIIKIYQNHKKFVIILVIIFLLAALFLGQKVMLNLYNQSTQSKQKVLDQALSKKASDEYKELIAQQKERAQINSYVSSSPSAKPKARGKYKVNVVFVKPKYMDKNLITPLIDTLSDNRDQIFSSCNGASCSNNVSLNYIATFYKEQALKYGVEDFDIEMNYTDLLTVDSLEIVGDMAQFWGKDPFGIVKLTDSFEKILKENKLVFNRDEQKVLFLFFDDSYTPETAQEGRFYEHKTFRSFAQEEHSRAFVNIYNFDTRFADTVAYISAHELLHLFGTTDKYYEQATRKRVCSDKGLGNPDKSPLLPQTTAEIMCGYVELDNSKFKRGSFVENTFVINKNTARELGWVE